MSKNDLEKLKRINDPLELESYLKTFPNLKFTIEALLREYYEIKHVKTAKGSRFNVNEPSEYDDSWKAMLAEELLVLCLDFFIRRKYISTKAHMRLVEEVKDMINVEVSRGKNLPFNKRTMGHA
ncbi:MAG: hypothetical protein QW303_08995 [Nitrososphaerota archaeon]